MMHHLGELEQLVLLALVHLGDEAYGVTVQGIIAERTGRTAAFATIYTTLARLENKGLVTSHLGAPTAERGGRAKKYFSLTSNGRSVLKHSLKQLRALTHGLGESWSAT